MNYKEAKTLPLVREKTGCKYKYCLSQFLSIQKWRSFYTKSEMEKSINKLLSNKNKFQQIITESELSNKEKISSLQLIRSFYSLINNYEQVPVLTEKAVPIYSSTTLKSPCGDEDSGLKMFVRAPAGIPAFVLEENEASKKVLLFDTRDGSMMNPLTQKSCINNQQNWLPVEANISPKWPTK